jgi:predicted ester cyclase
MYFKAFPDLYFEVEQIIASGDHVVSRWGATGTHKGEFDGIPPTNRQVSSRGCTVSEVRVSRIVKSSMYFEQLSLLRQLGVAAGKAASSMGS